MKTIVFFENTGIPYLQTRRIIERIRAQRSEDTLVVISAGDFTADGLPVIPASSFRADAYMEAGADLILSLPAASVLGGFGKKDFASIALVQRLHAADALIFPCIPLPGQSLSECERVLRSCSMLIFRERPDYRQKFKENLKNGMRFMDAQKDAVCTCLPETAELLCSSENRFAISLMDAMLQLYYLVNIEFMDVSALLIETADSAIDDLHRQAEGHSVRDLHHQPEVPAARDLHHQPEIPAARAEAAPLVESIKALLQKYTAEELLNISGSDARVIAALFDHADDIRSAGSFSQVTELLRPFAPSADSLRLFLLKAVLGIRHSSMQICGLHVYSPYCHVLGENPEEQEAIKRIKASSWVPFVKEGFCDLNLDDSFRSLMKADQKADQLSHRM